MMGFQDEMERLRLERLVALTQNRELRAYRHTQTLAGLDSAVKDGYITAEDMQEIKDRETRRYESDMAEMQNFIDDLNTVDLPRITPAIVALVRKLQVSRTVFSEDERFLYPNDKDRIRIEIVQLLEALIDGMEGDE